MESNNKYFIYVRKSTDDRSHQLRSIADQVAEIRELVRRERLDVVGSYEESQSAMTKGRPLFNEMLQRIEAGEADGIIAWHPDRLARNAFDGGRVIDLIDEGKLTAMRFCSFWFEPTAQGKLMLNLAFGQSKYYSDSLSINIRRGQRQKIADGVFPGKAPLGYCNEPTLRTIVFDPLRAPLVKEAFELYATGKYTLSQIAETMNAKGLRSCTGYLMAPFRYQDFLRNPFYYGMFVYRGEMHEGTHEPLVTKATFDAVQEAMKERSKACSVRLKSYVYRGLLKCGECGCGVTMETQKGHNYLRCTKRVHPDCTQPYVREESMTAQIAAAVTTVSVPDDCADWLVERLRAERAENNGVIEAAKAKVQKQVTKVETTLDRLTAAYLDAGAFTATEFRERKAQALSTKRKLLDDLTTLDSDETKRFEPLIQFISGSKQLKYVAQRGDPKELRSKLEKIGSNLKMQDRKLTWTPRGAWQLVVDQGSFAHVNTALVPSAANCRGETHQTPTKWRRGESNPRPEITSMTASTCVVDFLISTPATKIDTLRRNPDVCFLASLTTSDQRDQPAFCGCRDAGITPCRGCL
jgi:site-specific DNA recombinase